MAITALSHGPSHNRPTQYEVEVVIWGREPIIAGYTARKTKASLLAVAMQNNSVREEILAALPADDNSSPIYNSRQGWTLGNSKVRWSGGTLLHPMGVK